MGRTLSCLLADGHFRACEVGEQQTVTCHKCLGVCVSVVRFTSLRKSLETCHVSHGTVAFKIRRRNISKAVNEKSLKCVRKLSPVK